MKKYVVVSTNNNPDYIFFAPYIEKAWNSFGWNLFVMITDDVNESDLKLTNPESVVIRLPKIEGLRTESIAQAGRLYAGNYFPLDALLMTSDMDLLPLSNYWNPNENHITVYGHDLTDHTYIPMGYVAMTCEKWTQVMMLSGNTLSDLERDLKENKQAYSEDWSEWWNADWQILTDKLSSLKSEIKFINRGRRDGSCFAFGRVDRGDSMQIPIGELIDAHCENNNVFHPIKMDKFLSIFERFHGKL